MLKKVLFKDIEGLNIIGGQITSRIEAKLNYESFCGIRVLSPKAIKNGCVYHYDLGMINISEDLDPKKITKEGDIVIKLSTPYDACLITKEDEELLVPSFCAIINDVPEYISKEYLLAFLNSNIFINQIKDILVGKNIPILTIGQLKKIEIPIPDRKVQDEIGKQYISLLEKRKLLEKIVSLENEYIESRFFELEEEI